MVIKKHKPSLEGVLKRRRTSVAEYFSSLGVTSHEQLVVVLESLLGPYRVSEKLQEEAFAWVATLKKPEEIPQKPEESAEPETKEVEEEKPKRAQKRPTKRSTGRKKTTTKKSKPAPKPAAEDE